MDILRKYDVSWKVRWEARYNMPPHLGHSFGLTDSPYVLAMKKLKVQYKGGEDDSCHLK